MQALKSDLEAVLPRYDVAERHRRLVRAAGDVTFQAFRELTPAEVPLAALLSAVRSLPARLTGRPGLPVQLDQPILDQFVAAGFAVLSHRPEREIVVGVIAQMWKLHGVVVRPDSAASFIRFDQPGFVKAAMGFAVAEERGGTWAITETRVAATDASARRVFRRYWLLIRPFSGLVRRSWLRGLAARAVAVDVSREVRHTMQVTRPRLNMR